MHDAMQPIAGQQTPYPEDEIPNPIVHYEIMGKDSAKTQEFYSGLFGWTIDTDNPVGYGVAMTQGDDGVGINGGVGSVDQGGHAYVSVYAQVDDPQAYLDKAVSMGATVAMEVTEVPEVDVVVAMFIDPDGNCIGLVKG